MQVYPFVDGALYQVYASPGQITDIALQPGEQLVGAGPVAAGDTVRWIIGDTESGAGGARQIHILVKPTRPELLTNLVINTDRRTYHMELRSTPSTYMASVSWQYPQDQLIALRRQNAEAQAAQPVATGIDLARVNFRYDVRAIVRRGGRCAPSTTAGRCSSSFRAASARARCRRCSSSARRATPPNW
jgi:type IV secretion system protein VirB9